MSHLRQLQARPSEKLWPSIPEGMTGVQIVAIARIVERVCGTAAAASYLAEAVAAFDKKARSVHANYMGKYEGPALPAGAISPRPRAKR